MSFQEHYYETSFATFDKKHYRTGKIDFIFFSLTVVMMTWEDQVITPKNCRPLNSWAVLANRRQNLAVYDPSSQLIWGVGVVKRKGHTSGLTSLGLHSPKPGNLILDACITGPKVALHICAGTHIQDGMTGSVPGQMLLLLAVSKEKAGHPGRQSQSVLLLSTHHIGREGQKIPTGSLNSSLQSWMLDGTARGWNTVLGLQNILRLLKNVIFLYK